MDTTVLSVVQQEQFRDKAHAERMLLGFLRETFPLDVVSVELRPLAVSLNSFNGFVGLSDGRRLFFKTHTEQDSSIDEYYNSRSLAAAGYPVIQPLYSSTAAGRQLLIYEVVEDPTVFDIAWQIDNGGVEHVPALTAAQRQADQDLFEIYVSTLEHDAEETASAPVHQLFYHRLNGQRYRQFYPETGEMALPGGAVRISDLFSMNWRINGQDHPETLTSMVARGVELLRPVPKGPSVVGHGDAHNGNVFFHAQPPGLVYFDPAFAGRHNPLLDLTKPLFHNVFAMWMYYPREMRERLRISFDINAGTVIVDHDHRLSPVRRMFFDSKVENVLVPTLIELKRRGWLSDGWRDLLKAALMCCPLLTMNLTDGTKFSPEVSALGLAYAVEMGSESRGVRSVIDQALDGAAAALR